MDLKTELEIVIQEIVNDARNKWCSHDEEEDGIKEYADNIVKSLLNDSSLKLPCENCGEIEKLKYCERCYNTAFDTERQ